MELEKPATCEQKISCLKTALDRVRVFTHRPGKDETPQEVAKRMSKAHSMSLKALRLAKQWRQ